MRTVDMAIPAQERNAIYCDNARFRGGELEGLFSFGDLAGGAPHRRNAERRPGVSATTAQWHAERAAQRPKPAKLAGNAALRTYVQDRLAGEVAAPGGAAADRFGSGQRGAFSARENVGGFKKLNNRNPSYLGGQ